MLEVVLPVLALIVAGVALWKSRHRFQNRSVARKHKLLSDIDQKLSDLNLILMEAAPLYEEEAFPAFKNLFAQAGLSIDGLDEAAEGFHREVESFQEISKLMYSGQLALLDNARLTAIRRTLDTGIRRWGSWLKAIPAPIREILRGASGDDVNFTDP